MIFDIGVEWFINKLIELGNWLLLTISLSSSTIFFENQYVGGFLSLATDVSWLWFGVLLALFFTQNAEVLVEGNFNVNNVVKPILMAIIAIFSSKPLTLFVLEKSYGITEKLGNIFEFEKVGGLNIVLFPSSSIILLITMLAVVICVGKFVIGTFVRNAEIFTLLMIMTFYFTDIMLGDGRLFFSWIKQVVAVIFTQVITYLVLMIGISFLFSGNTMELETILDKPLELMLGIGTLIASARVPKLLQHYGHSVSTGRGISGAMMGANQALSLIGRTPAGKFMR